MLQGLRGVEGGEAALPFVSLFYSSSSTNIWEDDASPTTLSNEKGVNRALFAVGQHSGSCTHTPTNISWRSMTICMLCADVTCRPCS